MSVRTLTLAALAAASMVATAPVAAQTTAPNRPPEALRTLVRAVSFTSQMGAADGALLLPLASADDLASRGAGLSADVRTAILRALASAEFRYRARATLSLRGIGDWNRILVIGLGADADALGYQNAGAVAGRALLSEAGPITVLTGGLSAEAASEIATGLGIGGYRSDLYRTEERDDDELGPTRIVTDAPAQATPLYANRGRHLVDAMVWTRDISNEPANVVYPESFVQRARAAFAGLPGVTITVLDVPQMERLGMGAITGSGRGSERPPRMLIIRYRGQGATAAQPIVLAGKGITFDSGGISIKPNDGMSNMKMDMSGAASVTGAVLALARSRAPVHVVAVSALSENMPDGAAIRPGDVLTAMNGMTIEILSTDAEGRLVLADALSYAERHLNPAVVVDVATLTGAMSTAVGDDYAGMFTRHDALARQLDAAGRSTGERLWHLPLHESYAEATRSTIADIKNSSYDGGAGGGGGAYFIGQFISREIPWAHLDIASVAFGGPNDWKPAGSAGFGVRLLERFVLDYEAIPRGAGESGG